MSWAQVLESAAWLLHPASFILGFLTVLGLLERRRPPRVTCPTKWRYPGGPWHRCDLEDPLHAEAHRCVCGSSFPGVVMRRGDRD